MNALNNITNNLFIVLKNRAFGFLFEKCITFVHTMSYQESISKQNTATRTVTKSLPQKQVILSKSFV